jgi:hypothetical protein
MQLKTKWLAGVWPGGPPLSQLYLAGVKDSLYSGVVYPGNITCNFEGGRSV